MKYFDDYISVGEIKAETLISQMDIKEDIEVHLQGIFSRNYSDDLISIANERGKKEEENITILDLSRDGIFHLLPEGLFFRENLIKNMLKHDFDSKYKKFKEEKERIELFFQPFDTEYFKLSLELEKRLNTVAEKGNSTLMNTLEDEPEIDTKHKYISKIKILLPFVSQLRGNHILLIDILKNVLLAEKIEIKEIKPLYMRFIIHKAGLSKEEYKSMDEDLIDFFDFFCQWFLPVEIEYDYRIKDYKNSFTLGNTMLLEYNTHL